MALLDPVNLPPATPVQTRRLVTQGAACVLRRALGLQLEEEHPRAVFGDNHYSGPPVQFHPITCTLRIALSSSAACSFHSSAREAPGRAIVSSLS